MSSNQWPKPVRVHKGVFESFGRVEWGEPDDDGFYTPTIYHEECPPCIDNGVSHQVGMPPHITAEKEPSA